MTNEKIEETKRQAQVMLAACEPGAVVQWSSKSLKGPWTSEPNPAWAWEYCEYRIQPKPTLIPLSAEDVPPGSVVRHMDEPEIVRLVLWTSRSSVGIAISFYDIGGPVVTTYEGLRHGFLISRDGGKTWQRCEKPQSV